jgi:hypothetical protein
MFASGRTHEHHRWFCRGCGFALAIGLGLAVTAGPLKPTPPDVDESVLTLADGLYTTPGRTIICRIQAPTILCANNLVDIRCEGAVCKADRFTRDLDIAPMDRKDPSITVLPEGKFFEVGKLRCIANGKHLQCNFGDEWGGFAIDDNFARNSNYDDAPWDWPVVRRRYGPRDFLPGI